MFDVVINYFESINPILAALYGTLFTWFLTALGASFVIFFKNMNRVVLDGMLGLTAGGLSVGVYPVLMLVLALALFASLQWVLRHTEFGRTVRATADFPDVCG